MSGFFCENADIGNLTLGFNAKVHQPQSVAFQQTPHSVTSAVIDLNAGYQRTHLTAL